MRNGELLDPINAISSNFDADNRRKHERLPVDFHFRVVEERHRAHLGDVVDISIGGMKLMTKTQLPPGGTHALRVELAMGNGFMGNEAFEATIAWAGPCEDGQHFYAGVQFLRPTGSFLTLLQTIITQLGG